MRSAPTARNTSRLTVKSLPDRSSPAPTRSCSSPTRGICCEWVVPFNTSPNSACSRSASRLRCSYPSMKSPSLQRPSACSCTPDVPDILGPPNPSMGSRQPLRSLRYKHAEIRNLAPTLDLSVLRKPFRPTFHGTSEMPDGKFCLDLVSENGAHFPQWHLTGIDKCRLQHLAIFQCVTMPEIRH